MSERKVVHEVKLQKSVVIILGALAFGVCANAFGPTLSIQNALADYESGKIRVEHTGEILCYGCN